MLSKTMSVKVFSLILLVLVVSALLFQRNALAEIYKYQDNNGRWQYSDMPKKGAGSKALRSYKNVGSSSGPSTNYVDLLKSKYRPSNPVQKATMAVVTVKSSLGSGSGFFVTDDCYLITNKHVVRPVEGKQWNETQTKIQQNALTFEHNRLRLSNEKKRLAISKEKLDEYQAYMNGLSSEKERLKAQREFAVYAQRYQQDKQRIDTVSARFTQDERKFNQQQSDFNFSSTVANVAQSFDVILKDNSKTRANLIKVSATDDLALLKVNGCKAPFLTLDSARVSQGVTVHAIGSPLGMRDQVTQGTVTHVSFNGIATDAQILPGNSGGPLIRDNGHVVAVNTIKVAKGSALNTGFGVSIPVHRVRQNFGSYLR